MSDPNRRRSEGRVPPLVALLIRNAALGFCVAIVFVAAMLLADVGGLGTLVVRSPDGVIAVFALTFATGLTFGSVQMGIAIMQLGEEEQEDGDGPHDAAARLIRAGRRFLDRHTHRRAAC
ncbi:hypothetical protein L2U69_03860 [Zavarzinia compransoris]|uniref:hypothetical protein n=1 Tax=Zavarzinia marina TaxID=2911065 RepID=UPI001F19338F|nr:hypothetical protein [Zavarzinia marina]MCF4164773.1 hypothetical protein [Zavarzinia marina]